MNGLKLIGSRLLSLVRIVASAAALAIVPALVIYLNYSIDCSGYFQGDLELREVSNMVLAGEDLVGYELLNEKQRYIMKIIANNMDPLPKTIALGSSRILQLNTDILRVNEGEFFNCALTGGDAADAMGTFYLFDREDRLPETVIIGFDPWLLRTDARDKRSDQALFAEFANTKLGYNMEYEKADTSEKWKALYSPAYFQNNTSFLTRSETGVAKPQVVQGDLYNQTTEVKCGDGSILYDVAFRTRPQDQRNFDAMSICGAFLHMEDYLALDQAGLEMFDRFVAYMQSRGVNVVFMLTPYHPIVYDFATENATRYGGFLETEPAIRAMAQKYNITVYGSYNPHAIEGVAETDFYDGLHCTGGAIEKLLWGVGTPVQGEVDNVLAEDDTAPA